MSESLRVCVAENDKPLRQGNKDVRVVLPAVRRRTISDQTKGVLLGLSATVVVGLVACAIDSPPASEPTEHGVPVEWIDRTCILESGGFTGAIGKAGERGPYQIMPKTWKHYSSLPFKTAAHDPTESRRVAALILADCIRACERKGKPITFENVRYFYRHGGF